MDLGLFPVDKPNFKRGNIKRGVHTKITPKVRKEVERRSSADTGYVICERCGVSRPSGWFEKAHLTNASQYGSGRVPWNIANLCGPRTLTGSCHQLADDTAEGKDWKLRKQTELYIFYKKGEGQKHWKGD